jgi:hypothetical protein
MTKLMSILLPKTRPDLSKESAYKVFDWWLNGWHCVIIFFFVYLLFYAVLCATVWRMGAMLVVPVGFLTLIVVFVYLIAPIFELFCRGLGWPRHEIEQIAPAAKTWLVCLSVGGVIAFSGFCFLTAI